MKKVLLISPNSIAPLEGLRRLVPPLSLLYIGAVLKQEGYEVKIIDSSCEGYGNLVKENENYLSYGLSPEELERRIREFNPDIVGVTSPFSARQRKAFDICRIVRKINPKIPIIIGGLHPTLFPDEMLNSGLIDYVIMGEGEFRIRNLLNCLNSNKEPNFDGVAYRKNNKNIIISPTTFIKNLDDIPYPARDLVDMERYFEIGLPFAPYSKSNRTEQLFTTRGCPFHCNFCSSRDFWGNFRARSVDNVIGEVKELIEKYGIEEIQFSDDNMILDRERALELFKRLKQFNLHWCAPQGLLPSKLDEKILKAMGESGAYQITISIESGSERVRSQIMHKSPIPNKERMKELIKCAHDNGVQVHTVFVVGLPGEKKEEIYQTLKYPEELDADSVAFMIANPVPGSDLYIECLKKGYIKPYNAETNRIMDFRTAEIRIPKDSQDYFGFEPEELEQLLAEKTRQFNEQYKKYHYDRWAAKFTPFIERHPEEREKIFGRMS